MRFVRFDYLTGQDERGASLGDWSVFDGRIVFNRFETWLIRSVMWARELWFEHVTRMYGRAVCRLFRWHNVFCRGRQDHHVLGVGLVDPDRWHHRPRR